MSCHWISAIRLSAQINSDEFNVHTHSLPFWPSRAHLYIYSTEYKIHEFHVCNVCLLMLCLTNGSGIPSILRTSFTNIHKNKNVRQRENCEHGKCISIGKYKMKTKTKTKLSPSTKHNAVNFTNFSIHSNINSLHKMNATFSGRNKKNGWHFY